MMDIRTALQRLLSGIGGGGHVASRRDKSASSAGGPLYWGGSMMPGTPRLRLRRTRLRLNRRTPDAHIRGYTSVPRHDGPPDAQICGYASVPQHDGPPDCAAAATVGHRRWGTGRRGATKRPVNRVLTERRSRTVCAREAICPTRSVAAATARSRVPAGNAFIDCVFLGKKYQERFARIKKNTQICKIETAVAETTVAIQHCSIYEQRIRLSGRASMLLA